MSCLDGLSQSILFCLAGEYVREKSRVSTLSGDQNDQKLLLLVQVCTQCDDAMLS